MMRRVYDDTSMEIRRRKGGNSMTVSSPEMSTKTNSMIEDLPRPCDEKSDSDTVEKSGKTGVKLLLEVLEEQARARTRERSKQAFKFPPEEYQEIPKQNPLISPDRDHSKYLPGPSGEKVVSDTDKKSGKTGVKLLLEVLEEQDRARTRERSKQAFKFPPEEYQEIPKQNPLISPDRDHSKYLPGPSGEKVASDTDKKSGKTGVKLLLEVLEEQDRARTRERSNQAFKFPPEENRETLKQNPLPEHKKAPISPDHSMYLPGPSGEKAASDTDKKSGKTGVKLLLEVLEEQARIRRKQM